MGLREIGAALRRNVLVILALLLVTAAGTAYVWTHVPVTYQAQSTMIVLLPNENVSAGSSTPVPVNPYLSVGALSAQVAASALANVSGSDEFLAALHRAGVTSTTTVDVATYGGGVVLELTAENRNAPAAARDLGTLSEQLSAELERRQEEAGAPHGTLMTVTTLTDATSGTALTSSRTKLAAVAVSIGLVVTIMITSVVDAARRRRALRAGTGSAVAEPSAGGVPAASGPGRQESPRPEHPAQEGLHRCAPGGVPGSGTVWERREPGYAER